METYLPLRVLAFLALVLQPAPVLAADPATPGCVECGVRKPGLRPRELAILSQSVDAPLSPSATESLLDPFAAHDATLNAGCDAAPSPLNPLCAIDSPANERFPAGRARSAAPEIYPLKRQP